MQWINNVKRYMNAGQTNYKRMQIISLSNDKNDKTQKIIEYLNKGKKQMDKAQFCEVAMRHPSDVKTTCELQVWTEDSDVDSQHMDMIVCLVNGTHINDMDRIRLCLHKYIDKIVDNKFVILTYGVQTDLKTDTKNKQYTYNTTYSIYKIKQALSIYTWDDTQFLSVASIDAMLTLTWLRDQFAKLLFQ